LSKKNRFYKIRRAKIVAITFLLGAYFITNLISTKDIDTTKADKEQITLEYALSEVTVSRFFEQIEKEIKPIQKTYRTRLQFFDSILYLLENRWYLSNHRLIVIPLYLAGLWGSLELILFIHDSDGKKREQIYAF
jgi:hypothetical protein